MKDIDFVNGAYATEVEKLKMKVFVNQISQQKFKSQIFNIKE